MAPRSAGIAIVAIAMPSSGKLVTATRPHCPFDTVGISKPNQLIIKMYPTIEAHGENMSNLFDAFKNELSCHLGPVLGPLDHSTSSCRGPSNHSGAGPLILRRNPPSTAPGSGSVFLQVIHPKQPASWNLRPKRSHLGEEKNLDRLFTCASHMAHHY